MSVLDNPEVVDIVAKIGSLYLTESFSDVEFVVDGERLPAHQVILGQRCPVFKAMFSPNNEFKRNVVELPETSLEAFKLLLKFIYTGTVKLDIVSIDTIFDAMAIADTYEMEALKKVCIEYLKSVCAVEDVVDVLNEAMKRSNDTLINHFLDYVGVHCTKFIGHESFNELHVEALHRVLERPPSEVSAVTIFHAFVKWMESNPSESEHFAKLLKQMDLTSMKIDEIVETIRPLNLVDANVLLDILCEHAKKKAKIPSGNVSSPKTPDDKVSTTDSDDEITSGEYHNFYRSLKEDTMKHTTGSGYITINFNFLTQINYLEFVLPDGDWSYWVEFSKDNDKWTRVIDYSKYICRGVQELHFKTRVVRHLRICGTAPVGRVFEITRLYAYDNSNVLDVDHKTNIVIPSENVAERRGTIIQGTNSGREPNGMLNTHASAHGNSTYHRIGLAPIIVQLAQPYLIDSMNINLFNHRCSSSYHIEVSTDKKNWTRVWSEEMVYCRSHVRFQKQPVVFIKFTGTFSKNYIFSCKRLECPAVTHCQG